MVVLFVSCSLFTNAQFVLQWQQRLGGLATDQANSIIQTTDSGYAVLGTTNSNDSVVYGNHGGNDFLLFKLDANGNQEWHRWYGSSVDDNAQSIIQTPDGGYLMAGSTNGNDGDVTGNNGNTDVWLIKTDHLGFIEWQKCYGGTGTDGPTSYYNNNYYQENPAGISIINTLDGGYMLGTSTNSNNGQVSGNHGGYDYWLVKLNDTGAIQWQKCYGADKDEILTSVIQSADGTYAAAGYSDSDSGQVTGSHVSCYDDYNYGLICSYDYWIIKTDTAGNLLWEKSLGGTGDDIATSIAATDNGGYIVAGYTVSTDSDVIGNHGSSDYWLVRLDSAGGIVWKNCYGGSSQDEATSVIANNNGGFMVVGNSYSIDGEVTNHHDSIIYTQDIWAVLLDSMGNITRQNSFGGSMNDAANSVVKTNDGGYAIAGYTNSNDGDVSPSNTEIDFWVVKLNTNVGINEIKTLSGINLYPNPNNGDFILFCNHSSAMASTGLNITDITGRTVLQKNLKTGNGKTSITTDLENGIYFWQLNSENKTIANGKLIILK